MHRITREIFAVITLSQIGPLALKLGKKTSTFFGAIHLGLVPAIKQKN